MMVLAGSPVVKWDSVVGRFYQVEAASDLTSGSWAAESGEIAAAKSQTAFSVPALIKAASKGFAEPPLTNLTFEE